MESVSPPPDSDSNLETFVFPPPALMQIAMKRQSLDNSSRHEPSFGVLSKS